MSLLIIINTTSFKIYAQEQASVQSSGLNAPVFYEAKDSIVADIPNQIVRLYGDAKVNYEDIELLSELIEIDIQKNEVTATYGIDSLGNPFGKPLFTAGGEQSECDYIKYNFDTKKGFVKEVRMQQGEGYIHMAESKVQPNEEIHFRDGKFTTCSNEKPHYHFKLTRAIVVPDKRIITGPVYMQILRVPLPLAAPFGFFPNSETKKAGIIIPDFSFNSYDSYGFGITDLGYYIPLGEYWETYFYGTVFTSGRWGIRNETNYYQKYKYRGNFGLKFEQLRGKFYAQNISNKLTLKWTHNQDAKSHPSIKFSTNINYVSDNSSKTTLDLINEDYFNNTFNSSINLTKGWNTNRFNGAMTLKSSLQQNTQSGNYTIQLPSYNLTVNRFDLGVLRGSAIGKKWYENITVNYSLNAENSILAPDSIFTADEFNQIGDYAANGIKHNVGLQSNLNVLKGRFTLTPALTYNELWNFQSEDLTWNEDLQKIDTTSSNGFRSSRNVALSGRVSSNFYGYYQLVGPSETRFRHVASPNVSFTLSPDIGLFEEIQIDSTGKTQFYSPFYKSKYREGSAGASGRINFDVNNTLEMKRKNKKDTLNNEVKSLKLIDALSVNGNYDFLKDSFNLSDFNLSFRTSRFFNIFSFQSNATFTPYSWNNETGAKLSTYAWNDGNGLGRFSKASSVINANFTNAKGRAEQEENDTKTRENANNNKIATSNRLIDFEIPWQLNIAYNISYTRASISNNLEYVDSAVIVHTAQFNGDINIAEKWKVGYMVDFDLITKKVPQFRVEIWRDLHCWETSLKFQQFGPFTNSEVTDFKANWSVQLHIGIKADMFQAIKYDQTIKNPFPL
ncbi:putative LPS assembly protein LptD [Crocinitomix catalasitica]|uniref:putative LPS assembly protein LptD n=1 Tax=Crocinitomix catalasitica TaxID=184607 RepID=UPI0012FBE7FE|nr:putative LPS assembly protein LptD [Crocinitomix catalasitica]